MFVENEEPTMQKTPALLKGKVPSPTPVMKRQQSQLAALAKPPPKKK